MNKKKCGENPALVMECALDMGETLLRCGAEILRVEDTIVRIWLRNCRCIFDFVIDYIELEDRRRPKFYAYKAHQSWYDRFEKTRGAQCTF